MKMKLELICMKENLMNKLITIRQEAYVKACHKSCSYKND